MRFFAEFLRYYKEAGQRDILCNMTFWQLCCVGVSIVCAVWLFIVHSEKIKAKDAAKVEIEAKEDEAALKEARLEKERRKRVRAKMKKK